MIDEECPPNIRSELIDKCRRSHCRTAEFKPNAPTDWRPTSVTDPRDPDGRPFSDFTAWDFIAEQLEAGARVEVMLLTKPPGKKGYVIKIPTAAGVIYIKLQLTPPGVKGRSFHYSYY